MSLSVVSHNCYWFQGAPSLWGQERNQAHPRIVEALTRLYRQLAPDVLCLQEVPSEEAAQCLADGLGMQVAFARGGTREAYGGSVLWRGLDAEAEDLTFSSGVAVFERVCLVLRGKGPQSDWRLANVHLSSNRYAPGRKGDPVRLAELQALFADCQPDVVAGDFNATPGSPAYLDMEARGYTQGGVLACEPVAPEERRVDYIWIRDPGQFAARPADFKPASLVLAADADTQLSDHPPIITHLCCDKATKDPT
mgnify:CR=1 FL=1|jgi:endonuclease/exonuclease/phosphatase family metal-dependent hydrolase